MEITPIAYIYTDFPDKFGIPRQSGMTELVSRLDFCGKYASPDAFRGLEGFDYVWLIWGFDRARATGSLTVRPPRLGGNERVGVFASRSPFRPNGLGLSSVKLLGTEKTENGMSMYVCGADLASGTPVYDVKPYLPFTDSHPNARGGFSEEKLDYRLNVVFPEELQKFLPTDKIKGLTDALALDPRPSYQEEGREYGFFFADAEIKFTVSNGTLYVRAVRSVKNEA